MTQTSVFVVSEAVSNILSGFKVSVAAAFGSHITSISY